MADRVGREEGWQAAEREAGGVGDSYNAADEIGVGIVAGGAGGERRAAERPSGGGVGGEGVRGMRLGVGSAVVVKRGRNGCVRGMERDAGGRGQDGLERRLRNRARVEGHVGGVRGRGKEGTGEASSRAER